MLMVGAQPGIQVIVMMLHVLIKMHLVTVRSIMIVTGMTQSRALTMMMVSTMRTASVRAIMTQTHTRVRHIGSKTKTHGSQKQQDSFGASVAKAEAKAAERVTARALSAKATARAVASDARAVSVAAKVVVRAKAT